MGDALFDMWPIVWKSVQKGFLTDAALLAHTEAHSIDSVPTPTGIWYSFSHTTHKDVCLNSKKKTAKVFSEFDDFNA